MTSPFLPPLSDEKLRIKSGEAGKWQPQEGIAYSEVADSLARPSVGTDIKSISSIPDMWARPLFVDMVLRDQDHPLHGFIKAQWKGMLAAIALAEVKRLKLQAQLLDLEDLKSDTFIQALRELIPSSDKTVYQLTERIKGANRNPWEKIYVFVLNGQPVGMTSPATLVCPSEQGKWEGVTWWIDGQLHSPLDSSKYLTDDDKIQLWLWLDNLRQQLNRETGNSTRLKEILGEYQSELKRELKVDPNSQSLRLSKSKQYFGLPLTLGNLDALNVPIQARKQESSVKLLSLGKIKTEAEEVLFIPKMELLLDQWKTKEAKDIWVYDTSSAAIFDLAEFKKQYKGKVKFLTEENIFAEDFYYLEDDGNLPGALLPDDVDEITYTVDEQEHSLTPLLPLQSEILDFFSPEELIKRLKFSPTTIGNKSGVTVELTLSLSGGDFTIRRNYSIEPTNAITAKPYLEIWPNFKAPNWKAYYAFYFDDRTESLPQTIFRAVFPDATEIHPVDFHNFQLTRLESFPDYILCQDEKGFPQGLILLKTPPSVGDQNPNKTWTVGVDFGTSFTNVYYHSQNNNFRDSLTLTPLHLQITKQDKRMALLYAYFMSGNSEGFPLSSVLTIKGSKEQERPVFDGRLYIVEDVRAFNPNQDDIVTDLKWKPENISYNRTFLKHLALLISVEAANNHVKKINWSISYPSAFSRSDKNLYKVTWEQIIEDLDKTTGIEHQWLSKGNPYRAESLALAHYFADEAGENQDLMYSTCIDMGGGSSDISIWVGNRLIHQCSVLVAGRLLFSQFWKNKNRTEFLNQRFKVDLKDLTTNPQDNSFFVKLDGLLSAEGNDWLKKRTGMDDDPALQSIVQLSTIGISGLYYYIGLILRALDIEGKYTRQQNTPVYIGGNGCRILNWLDLSGKFTSDSEASLLFSQMLSNASGFDDTREKTVLSRKPKAEVAFGLVLDQELTKLTGLQADDEDLFAGEDCEINGVVFDWNHRLNLSQFRQIDSFELPSSDDDSKLTNLKCFLDDFCKSFKNLKITSIKPLRKYEEEQWRNDLWKSVKRRVEADLTKFEGRNSEDVRVEPLFILGLKALLKELNDRL